VTPEQSISIQGSEPRSTAEHRKRELFLGYLDAIWNQKEMESRFAPDFWPHDLIQGDQRPPVGVGIEAMRGFHETINSAFTAVRPVAAAWIEDDAELSEVGEGSDTLDLVGARMIIKYVHDRAPFTLPDVAMGETGRVYEPSDREVIIEVTHVMRVDNDGRVTDGWNRISMEEIIRQLNQNLTDGYQRSITVAAPRKAVWAVVSDDTRLGEWSGEYRSHRRRDDKLVKIGPYQLTWNTVPKGLYQDSVKWTLTLTEEGTATIITESCEVGPPRLMGQFLRLVKPGRRGRTPDLLADLARLKIIVEAPDPPDLKPDMLLTLLNVYTAQFGSYTTLLWQVPVLGLTAQAFLLTIALGHQVSGGARIAACTLSVIIACASWSLMHSQRGRAINQAELARRASSKLSLKNFLGNDFKLDDAIPKRTNAQDVWDADHGIYHIWKICMALFIVADGLIILSVLARFNWFT